MPGVELVPANGFEGLYSVTSDGRVWSHTRYRSAHNGMWLRPSLNYKGYPFVAMSRDGMPQTVTVHRLVAKAYLENPGGLGQINHINGLKTDNRASNLEWCTAHHNKQHAWDTGLCVFTERMRANAVLAIEKARVYRWPQT